MVIRFLAASLMMCVVSHTSFGQSDQEVRDQADEIEARAEEAVAKNLDAYHQANKTPLQTARNELSSLIKELNEDNRQTLANSLQSRLNKLEDGVQKRASARVPIVPPPQKPLLARIAGKWSNANSEFFYYLTPDGSFHEDFKRDGKVNARGTMVLISPEVAEVKLSNNYKIHVRLAGADMLALLIWDPNGKPFLQGVVVERVE